VDTDSAPITYSIDSITFTPPPGASSLNTLSEPHSAILSAFTLDNITGELRTASNMADFYDGCFKVRVAASNRVEGEAAYATIKVFLPFYED
jgi:hypothetical protein